MHLEVVHTPSTRPDSLGTVLLLHGACFGAWCWKENLQPWFAAQGYDVYAMSLRNHGNSEKKGKLCFRRIREYIDDLRTVVAGLHGPVYLIGHSMGGFIVQHYLAQPDAHVQKAVLLCSAPPHGVWRITLRALREHPFLFLQANLTWSLAPLLKHPRLAKKFMFSDDFSDEAFQQVLQQMQDESYLAFLDMLCFHLPQPHRVQRPVMVVGGEADYLFPAADVDATARAYNTTPYRVKGGSHNFFMEKGWEPAAEAMVNFFRS